MGQSSKAELFKDLHFIDRLSKYLVRASMEQNGLQEIGHPYLLKVLEESGDEGLVVSQKKFAKKLMITPAAVAQAIKRMEKEGLITKVPDEHDLRVNRIRITDKGRSMKKKMDSGLISASETFFEGFSDEEIDRMHDFSQRIITNIIRFRRNYHFDKENEN